MSAADSIDSHLVRVPFEALKRAAKDRKAAIDEASAALECAGVLPRAAADDAGMTDATPPSSREEHLSSLDELLGKLHGIKRKLDDVSAAESQHAQRVATRLEFLSSIGPLPPKDVVQWNRQRLDLMLVDYLLRRDNCGAAAALVARLPGRAGPQLTEAALFGSVRPIVAALSDLRDCGPALAWCAENRARLKRLKSKLEFKLRVQEFLELVRRQERLEAVQYARTHLAPWASQLMPELQHAFAALVFAKNPSSKPYADLFDEGAWAKLTQLFLQDFYRMHSLPPSPLLSVHLQAGLSVLKTPQSYADSCSREDPLHLPAFQRLAEGLPFAKHVHSKLVCSVTREIMNDANPPMVLPNGYVYSAKAVERLLEAGGGSKLTCPVTKTVHSADELRRAFVM